MANVRLTTTDNPWNPFTHFQEWYSYDVAHGYGCCDYVSRAIRLSDDLSEKDADLIQEEAIDFIVGLGVPIADGVLYKKVVQESNDNENDEVEIDDDEEFD